MRIAVIMACHNRVMTTLSSLEHLFAAACGISDLDVYLVDDGSVDDTGASVRSRFPQVNVIDADGSLYWAKGMRLAWGTAVKDGCKYDYFFWLNDDVKLRNDSLSGLLADAEKCGDLRGVIAGVCSEDASEVRSSYSATDESDVQYFPNGETPQRATGWFNGNAVLVPWVTYEAVGMISSDYTHARADYDYAERLKRSGIPFFASSHFVGVCGNDYFDKTKGLGLSSRISLLFKPGYWNIRDLFIFRRKYWGVGRAVVSVCHLIVHVIFMHTRGSRNSR